jgi:hypothetical protein
MFYIKIQLVVVFSHIVLYIYAKIFLKWTTKTGTTSGYLDTTITVGS